MVRKNGLPIKITRDFSFFIEFIIEMSLYIFFSILNINCNEIKFNMPESLWNHHRIKLKILQNTVMIVHTYTYINICMYMK